MAMWRKSPPELVALFDSVVPGRPAERRQMFGYPAAFVNGNLFMSTFEEKLVLRLPDSEQASLLKSPGAERFEPMPGRPMLNFVVYPPARLRDDRELRGWIAKAFAHGRSLPPKTAKPAAKAKPAKAKAASAKRAEAKRAAPATQAKVAKEKRVAKPNTTQAKREAKRAKVAKPVSAGPSRRAAPRKKAGAARAGRAGTKRRRKAGAARAGRAGTTRR